MNITPSHATILDPFHPKQAEITCEVLSWNPEEKTLYLVYPDGFSRFLTSFSSIISLTFPNCVNELV